ncbi:hypothetical protein ROHU_004542 [Labeo rohita]|uniref:Uncharacterized protein n=1 Tax=Labeo rohita TaxID=84645 RepID=A0A498NLU5_LABRO|nr:hypothetical protein ROHU_004542 [Labeo rohita]
MDNKIVTVNLKDSKGSIFILAVPKDTAEKMKNDQQFLASVMEQLRTAEKLTGSSQPITHFTATAARPPPPTTKCATSTTTRLPSSLTPTVVKLLPPPTIQCSIPPPENLPTSPSRPSSPSNKTDTRIGAS